MPFEPPPRKSFGHQHSAPGEQAKPAVPTNDVWLDRAKEAFDISTTFLDTNYRKDWEDSIQHFQSKHATGSKYYRDEYKFRSKMFRPKTRSIVRQNEAAAAGAFFSQLENISIDPDDSLDPIQQAAAAFRQEILNYRLSMRLDNPIKWFQVCVGGMQEANIYGIVSSKQYWDYEYEDVELPINDDSGMTVANEDGSIATQSHRIVRKDTPQIDLRPIECLRFDPAAKWTDVVNTSPYFIDMVPMRIGDVKAKIAKGEWGGVTEAELYKARNAAYDTTRQAREGSKEDSTDPRFSKKLSEFDMVWVHENFMRLDGEEIHFYTLGTIRRLSPVKKLSDVYLHGIRPYQIGTCVIEAHRAMPDAPVHLAKGLQREANEIVNSRLDNVKLVLNKRYLVRRGKQVDLQSLVRNAAGSITLVNDIEKDVFPMEFQDVTASAYAEQDRVNVDTDELLGSFSTGSIETNRKLGETVGGMSMLQGGSNTMKQYLIQVFNTTWVQPVLNQLDKLEQHYESNLEFLTLMAKKSNLQRWQIDVTQPGVAEKLLSVPLTITVNVANSAMDPTLRLSLFTNTMAQYVTMRAGAAQGGVNDMNWDTVKDYMFGLMGVKGAKRFSIDMGNLPPEARQMAAQMQQMQQTIQQLQQELQNKTHIKEMESQVKMMIAQAQEETKRFVAQFEQQSKTEREHTSIAFKGAMEHDLSRIQLADNERQRQFEQGLSMMNARLEGMNELLKHAMTQAKQSSALEGKELNVKMSSITPEEMTKVVNRMEELHDRVIHKMSSPTELHVVRDSATGKISKVIKQRAM